MIDKRFIKFLFVGGLNTLFGYSMYALFIIIGLHYSIAVLFSTILGVLFNFKTTGKLVFKISKNSLIFKFIGVYAFIYLLNVTSLSIFKLYKFDLLLAGAIVIIPLAMISFILNKKFVFEGKK
ncbi:MAG: GtrA family protein [uncultured bacterium]|nr:MAG: GtrA family protein [uncultured bacterium]HBH17996.1 polysaccharide biosynthesis protein GtrA [Cyanobacteria bacterium UBA9579]